MRKILIIAVMLLIIPLALADDCDRINFGVQDNLDINNRFIIYLNWDNEICMINSSCFGSLNHVSLITPEDIGVIEEKEQNLTRSYPKLSWQLFTKKRDNYEIKAELKQDNEIICTKTVEANFLPDIKDDIIVSRSSKLDRKPTKENPDNQTTQQETASVIKIDDNLPIKLPSAKDETTTNDTENNKVASLLKKHIIILSIIALSAAILIIYILRPK